MEQRRLVKAPAFNRRRYRAQIQKAYETYSCVTLPVTVSFKWQQVYETNNGERQRHPNKLFIEINRGVNSIRADLNFGNLILTTALIDDAVNAALSYLPEAICRSDEQEQQIFIAGSTMAALGALRHDHTMKSYREMMRPGLVYHCRNTVKPHGWSYCSDWTEKVKWEWQLERHPDYPNEGDYRRNIGLRIPTRTVLADCIYFYDMALTNPTTLKVDVKIPQAMALANLGKPLSTIIDIPGFDEAGVIIEGPVSYNTQETTTYLKIKSPQKTMLEAGAYYEDIVAMHKSTKIRAQKNEIMLEAA